MVSDIEKRMTPTGNGAILWRLYYFGGEVRSAFKWAQ